MLKKPVHITTNQPQNKTNLQNEQRSHGNVWQDKSDRSSDRLSVSQPASVQKGVRSRPLNTSAPRSQNRPVYKENAVPLQLWVNPMVNAEVQRQAELQGLSVSAVGAALLEDILRQKLHVQQAATLETVLEKLIARSYRSFATRLSALLVRIAFDTGQTRVLTTNILGRQPGMTEKILQNILQAADKRTKANLTRRTPQITDLITAVEKWLLETESREEGREGG